MSELLTGRFTPPLATKRGSDGNHYLDVNAMQSAAIEECKTWLESEQMVGSYSIVSAERAGTSTAFDVSAEVHFLEQAS